MILWLNLTQRTEVAIVEVVDVLCNKKKNIKYVVCIKMPLLELFQICKKVAWFLIVFSITKAYKYILIAPRMHYPQRGGGGSRR